MADTSVIGLNELVSKLNKIANDNMEEVLDHCCLLVENDAKRNCPVDKGQLRGSISHRVNDNEGVVYTNVEYAPYVEYGTGIFSSKGVGRANVPWCYQSADGKWHTTSGQKPQPFLIPALKNNRTNIISYIKKHINKEVSK